jgi:hypothetical protein
MIQLGVSQNSNMFDPHPLDNVTKKFDFYYFSDLTKTFCVVIYLLYVFVTPWTTHIFNNVWKYISWGQLKEMSYAKLGY